MSIYKDEEFNFRNHLDIEPEPDYLIKVPKNDFRAKMKEIYVEDGVYGEPITLVFCPREVWGALPPKDDVPPKPLTYPVNWASFPETRTESCMNPDECVEVIRQLQKDHMAAGHRDIKYNFMVGFDGIIYEGRGWLEEADRSPEQDAEVRGDSIDIGIIGDRRDQFQRCIFPSCFMEKYGYAWFRHGQGKNKYVAADKMWWRYPDWDEYTTAYIDE